MAPRHAGRSGDRAIERAHRVRLAQRPACRAPARRLARRARARSCPNGTSAGSRRALGSPRTRRTLRIVVVAAAPRGRRAARGPRRAALPRRDRRPSTPTPTGRFAVTDKLADARAASPYGCCILALSGRQPRCRRAGAAATASRSTRRACPRRSGRPPASAACAACRRECAVLVRTRPARDARRHPRLAGSSETRGVSLDPPRVLHLEDVGALGLERHAHDLGPPVGPLAQPLDDQRRSARSATRPAPSAPRPRSSRRARRARARRARAPPSAG